MTHSEVVDVLLLDLPISAWSASVEHLDLLRTAEGSPGPGLAALRALLARMHTTYGEVTAPVQADLNAAAERRIKAPIDVAYPIARAARDELVELRAAFDATDAESAASRPDLVAPPRTAAFRRWFLGELVRQIDGGIPAPWKDTQ